MIPLAVFGDPIGHSLSPQLHQIFARQANLTVNYQAILSPSATFAEQLHAFFAAGAVGANITLPHKVRVLALATSLSTRARLAGAANTLIATPEAGAASFKADNTDGAGLVWDLCRQLGSLTDKRVLILGAGGAVRGILSPLLEAGCRELVVYNRTPEKVKALLADIAAIADPQQQAVMAIHAFAPHHLEQHFDIVINAISAGHQGAFPIALQPAWLANASLAYDLSYGHAARPFLEAVAKQQSSVMQSDGLGMLVGQGAASFRLWTAAAVDESEALIKLRSLI